MVGIHGGRSLYTEAEREGERKERWDLRNGQRWGDVARGVIRWDGAVSLEARLERREEGGRQVGSGDGVSAADLVVSLLERV